MFADVFAKRQACDSRVSRIQQRQRQCHEMPDLFRRHLFQQFRFGRMVAKKRGVPNPRLCRDFADGDLIELLALKQYQHGGMQCLAGAPHPCVSDG